MTRSNLTRDEARRRAALVEGVRYEVTLDLTSAEDFTSSSIIRFRCLKQGAETFVDLTANEVSAVELNGTRVSPEAFDGHRIRLTGLREENELRVQARCAYHRTELGMHRFVDPVDGLIYLHTDFEPFDAHRVYACFDQPDLKGTFDFRAQVPVGWEVISNSKPAGAPWDGTAMSSTRRPWARAREPAARWR